MDLFLFLITSLIWGSTWLAIKFQLTSVDPLVSIVYRFGLAAVILFVYCLATGKKFSFRPRYHLFFLITGFFMFGFNYWLVYLAETTLPSGLVAITFTTIIFFNSVNNRIFLKMPIVPKIIAGGGLGVVGLGFVFYRELISFTPTNESLVALGFCLLSSLSASIGNTAVQVCQAHEVPIVQTELFAMVYGTLLMGTLALIKGAAFQLETSAPYIGSLCYLAVVGSVFGFLTYLTLLKNIGSDKAAYITLVFPIVALVFSTIYEGYTWSQTAAVGIVIIVFGNFVALRKSMD